jgi:peptide/nickel transport system permease protein
MSIAAISFRRKLAGNARHNPLAAIGVVLVVLFVIFALFAPWIAPQDPASIHLPARLDPPSSAHWFGTDELGRDILSRVIHGARISMLSAPALSSLRWPLDSSSAPLPDTTEAASTASSTSY